MVNEKVIGLVEETRVGQNDILSYRKEVEMLNPFGSSNTGSFFDFRGRLLKKMKSSEVEKKIAEILQNAYQESLKSESVVLSKAEYQRLLTDISIQLLNDFAKEIKDNR